MAERILYVAELCPDCVLRVSANQPESDFPAFVQVDELSPHAHGHFAIVWRNSWQRRLIRMWRVLRGDSYPWLEFFRAEELDAFIQALTEARGHAFVDNGNK